MLKVGKGKHQKNSKGSTPVVSEAAVQEAPKLARRRLNQKSTIKLGRTIAEVREHPESASERLEARRKGNKVKKIRLFFTVGLFVIGAALLVYVLVAVFGNQERYELSETIMVPYMPTIEVIDEDMGATGGVITSRMSEFIGQIEVDLRELGYTPTKAVIPSNTIREVDLYVEEYEARFKTTIDRGTAVTAEDIDRMIRYLQGINVQKCEYVDVRVDGRAFWK